MFGDLVNMDFGAGGDTGSSFSGIGDLFKNFQDMDWGKILGGVGSAMGPAMQGYGLLQQAMGGGQNRQPRMDRGSFGAGFQAPQPNAKQASGVAKDLQVQGVPEGAVSPDFYKNYLPEEFQNLPPEIIQQLIAQGNQQSSGGNPGAPQGGF